VDRSLERATGVALWRQIGQHLLEDVDAKRLTPGMRLPSEMELAQRFGVNRHTVRRAISDLEAKGIFQVRQGHGTFVHEHVVDYAVSRRTRFSENLARQHVAARGEFVESRTEAADSRVAKALGVSSGTSVVWIDVLRWAGNRPIGIGRHYFPARRFGGIAERFQECGSITKTLAAFGVTDYVRKSTRVGARMPDEREIALLRQPRNRPVLMTESVNTDESGTPVELSVACFAADRVQLTLEMP
jgi:GntR family phosphonate transport system transcriptional regulator